MNLSPEKKANLIKLGAFTVAGVLALWLLAIRPERARVDEKIKIQEDLSQKIVVKSKTIQTAEKISSDLQESTTRLQAVEDQMVSGDPYRWIIKTLSEFEVPHKMEFSKYDPPHPVDIMPPKRVPYKALSFSVTGTATYHDLGKFLSDLENSYPHISVHRLDLEPVPGLESSDEKLSFLVELYALVKPALVVPGAPAPRS
ncbi:MAG: hypothetical protein ABIQ35_09100 [Verrucomicrobiota bacterium]